MGRNTSCWGYERITKETEGLVKHSRTGGWSLHFHSHDSLFHNKYFFLIIDLGRGGERAHMLFRYFTFPTKVLNIFPNFSLKSFISKYFPSYVSSRRHFCYKSWGRRKKTFILLMKYQIFLMFQFSFETIEYFL